MITWNKRCAASSAGFKDFDINIHFDLIKSLIIQHATTGATIAEGHWYCYDTKLKENGLSDTKISLVGMGWQQGGGVVTYTPLNAYVTITGE